MSGFQQNVREAARRFDLIPLIELLERQGYARERIQLRSHVGNAVRPTIVESVEFDDPDSQRAHVTIGVNLGLLSCRSPLPSYFFEHLHDAHLTEPLTQLLMALDQGLLSTRCEAARPLERLGFESSATRGSQQEAADANAELLALHGMASPGGLQWLMARVFPEMDVSVVRSDATRPVPSHEARIGRAQVGESTLGGHALVNLDHLQATLMTEDAEDCRGRPWSEEGPRRLRDHVFPHLADLRLYLTVHLVELHRRRWLGLEEPDDSGHAHRRLGFARTPRQGERSERPGALVTWRERAQSVLFSGRVGAER